MNAFRTRIPPLSRPGAFLFVALAVASFHVAYQPASFGPLRLLIILYPISLVQLARLRTTRGSFYAGLLAGFLCVAPQLECFWRIFNSAAIPLWVILAFWIGAFVAMVHASLARLGPAPTLVLTPFVWTGLEYFRSEIYYLKFSWLNTGYAFADWQFFPCHTLGMYGVGFVIALFAFLVLITRWIFATSFVLASLLLFHFVAVVPKADHGETSIRLAGVQAEAPAEPQVPRILDRLLVKYPEADVLVLSEYSLDGPVPDSVRSWCRQHQRYLIVGGKDPAGNDNFYNTAFVVDPAGDVVFRQAKSVPIQFFKDGLPAPQQGVWNSPWGKIGICICYDLSYSRVVDRLVKMGAQLLIVPTMDVADWGRRQHELHALVAPVRAAEYGIPIFRVASSGISQAVTSTGRVAARTSFPEEAEALFFSFNLPRHGSLPLDRWLAPVSLCVTALLAGMLLCLRWIRRGKPEAAAPPARPGSDSGQTGIPEGSGSQAGVQRGSEQLQIRIHGAGTRPTLVYLPGLHGDWTLIGGLRKAVANSLRFVEITYPRTLDWSLEDYAAGVERALSEKGITGGWLLAESFGSQVAWPLVDRGTFRAEGVILAGGFVRHPARGAVRLAERICGGIPLSLLVRVLFGYATIARFRYRRSPDTLAGIHEFIARRTELDRQAATHRLRLVAQNDPRVIARQTAVPVYALSGWLDPIVPWFCVRRWLRRHCSALRDYQIVRSADHNVLGTTPDAAAKHILRWIAGNTPTL